MRRLFTWASALTILVSQTVSADEFAPHIAVLDRPGEPAWLEIGGSTAIASYTEVDGVFILTTLLRNGSDGEILRGRVALTDGQGHQMILNSEDGLNRDRFTFRRAGGTVMITGAALGSRPGCLFDRRTV